MRKETYISRQHTKSHIMRSLLFLMTCILMISTSSIAGNSAIHDQSDDLCSHTWESTYVGIEMNDVTDDNATSLTFKTDGSYSAEGYIDVFMGNWSLSGGVLDLGDQGKWRILMLTSTDLRLQSEDGDIELHFE